MRSFALVVLVLSCIFTFPLPAAAHNSFLSRAHKIAVKRSSGLARDIRIALRGVFVDQPGSAPSQSVFCVSNGGGNITVSNGDSNSLSPNGPSTTGSSQPASTSSAKSSPWKPIASYSGSTFFNGWSFYTAADPTNGNVQYVDQSTARSAQLIEINSAGNAVMRVETTPTVQTNRKSVRITTNLSFNQGLVILDAVHMPTGCGTWPAFWTNGPDWPTYGEIDIIEGVNNYTNNQATIHTGVGCSISSSNSAALGITGTVVGGTDCSAAQSNNEGCGVRSSSDTSFGSAFNSVGGGVYAMYWMNSVGIKVWYFQRGSIPSDITAGAPNPDKWSTPMAFWANSNLCNISEMFQNHTAIFDTTLCGDWAAGVWNGTGIPGQSVSCAQQTGFASCSEFIQQNGASFNEAYWEVSSVKIYQDTNSS